MPAPNLPLQWKKVTEPAMMEAIEAQNLTVILGRGLRGVFYMEAQPINDALEKTLRQAAGEAFGILPQQVTAADAAVNILLESNMSGEGESEYAGIFTYKNTRYHAAVSYNEDGPKFGRDT